MTDASTRLRWLIVMPTLTLGASLASAQEPLPRPLSQTVVALSEEFERIGGVRELRDSRVLVIDGWHPRFVVADLRADAVTPVSREGRGPGEYHETTGLHALPGDSTLLDDQRSLRWIILEGTRPVVTIPTRSAGYRGPAVRGADQQGRVLELRPFAFVRDSRGQIWQMNGYAESLLVLLHRRGAPAIDTVARLRGPYRGAWWAIKDIGRGARVQTRYFNAMAVEEQALLFRDGWIALARTDPYRVDWRRPDGTMVRGAKLPSVAVAVDDRQKRAAIKRHWRIKFEPDEMKNWPATLPPFDRDALVALPDGRLLIQRMPDATSSSVFYDIVDRTGTLAERLVVQANERIVGFGERTVYVVTRDDDDLERLRRHSWP